MRRMFTTYDIVATLGPASHTPVVWQAMLDAGVTAFRLNTSHLTWPQLEQWLDQLKPFRASSKSVSAVDPRSTGQQMAIG